MKCIKLISLLVFLCTFMGCDSSSFSAKKNGHLAVDGTFLVNERGEKVVLKGISYGWHNWWPRFYNASTVEYFAKSWGANVVRAAIGVEPDGAYIQNPQKALECVQAVADAAIDNDIYVIIDWHSHHIRLDEAKEFFRQMATRYKGVPNVIYEIFNEPVDDSWEAVKAYSVEIIKTIRVIEPNAIILVGTPHWDQDVHLAADAPIIGFDNIMYTLHFYANTHKQSLRDRGDYALSKGLPLFVSECAGMEASGDGAINQEEWNAWLEWMQRNSISWAAWSVSDKDESCSMITPSGSSEGNWKDEELNEWAKIVRNDLKKK